MPEPGLTGQGSGPYHLQAVGLVTPARPCAGRGTPSGTEVSRPSAVTRTPRATVTAPAPEVIRSVDSDSAWSRRKLPPGGRRPYIALPRRHSGSDRVEANHDNPSQSRSPFCKSQCRPVVAGSLGPLPGLVSKSMHGRQHRLLKLPVTSTGECW